MSFEEKMFAKTYGEDTPAEAVNEAVETPAETVVETKEEVKEPVAEKTEPVVETPVAVKDSPAEPSSDISFLKELGFESKEQLQEALNRQPEVLKPEFVNDESRMLYEAILQGKEDEIADVLYTRKQLAKLEGETSEEKILKAHIKFTNPEFDDSDVEDEYKEKYSLSEDAEFDESKQKREQKKLKQRIANDVAQAKQFFATKKQELKLPTFEKVTAQDTPAESQDDVFVQLLAENVKNFKGLTPIEFEHKDETSSIPIRYEWDNNKVSEIKAQLEQPHGYYSLLATRHYDGEKYNTNQIVEDVYVLNNWKSMLDAAVTQAVNKTKIEFLKTQKNISNNVPTERALPSEFQQDSQKEAVRSMFFGK